MILLIKFSQGEQTKISLNTNIVSYQTSNLFKVLILLAFRINSINLLHGKVTKHEPIYRV